MSVDGETNSCDASPHRRALCLLTARDSRHDTDHAINILKSLDQQTPTSTIANDLGAAYLVRAQRFDRASDLALAWESTIQSRTRDPRNAEAWFNEALICSEFGLQDCAERAVSELGRLDPESAWAHELRTRPRGGAAKQEMPTDGKSPSQNLLGVLSRTLSKQIPAWGQAILDADSAGADVVSAEFERVAAELAGIGASYLADVVEDLERRDADKASRMAVATIAATLGSELEAQALERAAEDLTALGSPLAAWVEIRLASRAYKQLDYRELHTRVAKVRAASTADHRLVRAHAAWIAGSAHLQERRPFEAIPAFERALELFSALGDLPNEINMGARLADVDAVIGQRSAGWTRRLPLLRAHDQLAPAEQHFVLTEASRAAKAEGLLGVAVALERRASRAAFASGSAKDVVIAYHFLADVYLESGDTAAAQTLASEARRALESLEDAKVRQSIEMLIHELEGRAALADDPLGSIEALSRAIDLAVDSPFSRVRLFTERAQGHLAINDSARAHADLLDAVAVLEDDWRNALRRATARERIESQNVWEKYLEQGRAVFDTLIGLLVDARRFEDALVVAERARARDVLDDFKQSGNTSLLPASSRDLTGLRRGLPEDATLIAYWLLERRLVIWRIDRTGIEAETVEVDSRALTQQVNDLIRGLSDGSLSAYAAERVLGALEAALIAPIRSPLEAGSTLVFIPDGVLHAVPFAALGDHREGVLVTRHAIAVAPSVTLAALLQRPRADHQSTPGSVLAFCPNLDPDRLASERLSNLAGLPGAAREARAVASIYPASTLLIGPMATAEALTRAAGAHDIVHIAGHAIATERVSHLIVAASDGAHVGALMAPAELMAIPFGRTRIVVLSACSSNGGHPIGALGVSRLVRPLLGAGVPSIVGALWDVRDRAVPELMRRFHEGVQRGLGPAAALRAAQIHMIEHESSSHNSVATWAPFQVVGNAY